MALVKVYTARDAVEAHFVRGLLEREGLAAEVLGDKLAIAIGELPPLSAGTLPAVWVAEESTEPAKKIVADFQSGRARSEHAGEAPWTCPNCGETIEPQFTDCWNCGAARPAGAEPAPAVD